MLKKVLLATFTFSILPVLIYAKISFDRLSYTSGLSQSTVLSIVKDSRGFMWFGGTDRLSRYNGRFLETYSRGSSLNSISSNDYIYALLSDAQNNLWIGTQNGLNRYLPETNSFERIPQGFGRDSLKDNIILSIASGRKGRVWFGTLTGVAMLESPKSRVFKSFGKRDGIADGYVYAIFEDSKGTVWVGTTVGLTRMVPKKHGYDYTTFANVPNNPQSLSGSSIKTIAEDKFGRIWVGTEADGLNLFDPNKNSFRRFRSDAISGRGLSDDHIRKILSTSDGKLWIGTMNGLNILNPDNFAIEVYKSDPESRKSLSDNSIKAIYEDDQGSVWVSTMFGGVCVAHKSSVAFKIYQHSRYFNSISSNIISSIAANADQNLWIGTEGQGLNFLDINRQTFKNYLNNPKQAGSLSSNTIKAVFKDRKGNIWIGLFQGGLELFDPVKGQFKHFRPDPKNADAISYGYVTSITEDHQGKLWVGTSSRGLNRFDPVTEKFTKYTAESPTSRISDNYIRVVYSDSKNNLWVGTEKGLNLLRAGNSKFEPLLTKVLPDTDSSSTINCIVEDHLGYIWIGTYRDGLIRYNPINKSFKAFNTETGLLTNNVAGVLEDDEGNLWLSSELGLCKFDPRKLTFINYNVIDGLPANQFNINAAYKDNKGRLYFGSYGGLVAFLPKDIQQNRKVPRVVFTGLKLFNDMVVINGEDGLLDKEISFIKEITFSADQKVFTFEFAALNFVKPSRNKYAYKLEGFDKKWNYVNIPSATYTNLPPGTYIFLVKASNNDGLWSNLPERMIVHVRPPFYATWWAYLFYFVLILGVLYFVNAFFVRQQRLKTELYYEHLNNERQNEVYQMKLDFFTKISHELRTPLSLIYAPLGRLIELTQRDAVVNSSLRNIKGNADRLLKLIAELLDFRKIETNNVALEIHKYDIVAFSRTVFSAFYDQAALQQITYDFRAPAQSLPLYFDRVQMEKILFNLISNSFKYTPNGGTISLALHSSEDHVAIVISDTGLGIHYEEQEKVFNGFYRSKAVVEQQTGWGIGLALVKNLVELHHGSINLRSKPATTEENGNTTVTVKLLKGFEHFNEFEVGYETSPSVTISMDDTLSPDETSGNLYPYENVEDQEKKYTVMVVEDNVELRDFLVESLENRYEIVQCANGLDAWNKAKEQVPDIIVSDLTMPEMDGIELCGKIKNEDITSHIPVIILTAMVAHNFQVGGVEAGADIYLTKPFSLRILELHIRNLLMSREVLKLRYSKQIMLMPKNVAIESPDEKFLDKLMKIVDNEMKDPEFNVASLVDQIGMSQTVLYKKIKALTGLSIADFIKSQRLKRAAQMLSENKLRINEIAYFTGFNNRKYFSQEFKKQFGKTPSEYVHLAE